MISAAYLRSAIPSAIARARALIEITQDSATLELRDLQRVCTENLNDAVFRLAEAQRLIEQRPDQAQVIGRTYQAMVQKVDNAECLGAFALKNQSLEDIQLNRLLHRMCAEIGFPLIPPTVSHTSQRYFEISPQFNLLRVPLIEGRFFLQLADLYHELCHPLVSPTGITNPRLDPLSETFLNLKIKRGRELDEARIRGERRRAGPEHAHRYALWRKCWIETWMEEFVCDAFGAYCGGPAYGWTHYHLCFRTNQEILSVPTVVPSSHPNDHARMLVILNVLKLRGFDPEATAIERAWSEFFRLEDRGLPDFYELCYPRACLEHIASSASTAFEKCGVKGLPTDQQPIIGRTLQDAWATFWSPNQDYESWEMGARESLLEAIA